MTPPLVELRNVTKSYGPTRALDDVTFAVRAGEVHVLAGENGAGKSTLIKILSGVVTDFEGDLLVNGQRTRFRDARAAAAHGIATIHQELSLVGSMTVAENLALPRPGSMLALVSAATEATAARKVLAEMDLDIDPTALVETLPLATRQLLEIARALAQHARVLILDEPTSALSEPEAERLLTRVEQLAKAGRGIVYISHRMEETDRLAHRITVLCDGHIVASRPAPDLPRDELVTLMMGHPSADHPSSKNLGVAPSASSDASSQSYVTPPSSEPLLSVRDLHLTSPGAAPLHGISFTLARGEILGLAGLRGSGTSETLAALYGTYGPAPTATIHLAGTPYTIESPARSITQGLLLLTNDRKKTVLPDLTITENITLSTLARLAPHGLVHLAAEARLTAEMTTRLRVATPSTHAPARSLSGGNQQKVALLRCIAAEPRVLLLDEPTRGVDISAKADIHRSLRALAAEGKGLVVITSELPELLTLCDRIAVLSRGRITETLRREDFSRERLRHLLDA